jgi:predicted CoA-binding protein
MTQKEIIDQIIAQEHIAVAGVSRNKKKFGAVVYDHLKTNGYNVYPVNPNIDRYNGDPCYRRIADLPAEVSALVTVTKPEVTLPLVREAADKGISWLWLQQGSESMEVLDAAREAGMQFVERKCIMMFAEPVRSAHRFHRFLAKLFGSYPK